jgi:hypothetical protein
VEQLTLALQTQQYGALTFTMSHLRSCSTTPDWQVRLGAVCVCVCVGVGVFFFCSLVCSLVFLFVLVCFVFLYVCVFACAWVGEQLC